MDTKKTFKNIKEKLSSKCASVRGFTYQFFTAYLKAKAQHKTNVENNIDDSYKDGYVTLFHCYDDVYESYFYTKNSCAYCVFLELMQDVK